MKAPARRMPFDKRINTIRMALAQIDEMLTEMEEGIEVDLVPAFDPKKVYHCSDQEFHAAIHYTDHAGHYSGHIWQTGIPPFPVSWDSMGRYNGPGHKGWDLINYVDGE